MKLPIGNIRVLFCVFAAWTSTAFGLEELFYLYRAPQALFMGNAIVANAHGYISNYHNPAGLGKMPRRRAEVNIIGLEGDANLQSLGQLWSLRQVDDAAYLSDLQNSPGNYSYMRYTAIPSLAIRGFSVSFLANHEFAALSDGTNVDVDTRTDVGATVGFARNFAGNLIKVGVVGKAIVRNQLKGTFAHTAVDTSDEVAANSAEGLGIGFDAGLLVTFPIKYLPSFGIVARDLFNTSFSQSNYLNAQATGTPDSIPQSVDVGFSINPRFSRRWQTRISVDLKHLEMGQISLTRRLHIGLQLHERARKRRFFVWLGMNQLLLPTGGIGLRLPGGNLEVGTYAQYIGATSSRRFLLRYTIGFF